MRNWIAGIMAVLGLLLVLGGAAVIVLRAMATTPTTTPRTTPVGETTADVLPRAQPGLGTRLIDALRNVPAGHSLIGWGIVLLVLGAVATGAISFNFSSSAGTR